jgi:CheY-specific phosphatase CheX
MRARFFGQHLLAQGLVTAPQLLAAIEYQERYDTRLGSCAVGMGLVTPFEVEQIRALQAREDLRFGEAAVKLGVLSDAQLQQVLETQQGAHVPLGDAVVALGYLTAQQVESAAAQFLATEARLEPEVVTIPDDLPLRDLAFELFHLAHKLLLRVCDLTSKTERLRIVEDVLPLSDRNAAVAISGIARAPRGGSTSGEAETAVMLCLPDAVAIDVAKRYSGELAPHERDVDHIVLELANLLCGNLQSVMAERGVRLKLAEPELLGSRISLPPGKRAALVPFLTHRGQVLVSMSLPSAHR